MKSELSTQVSEKMGLSKFEYPLNPVIPGPVKSQWIISSFLVKDGHERRGKSYEQSSIFRPTTNGYQAFPRDEPWDDPPNLTSWLHIPMCIHGK